MHACKLGGRKSSALHHGTAQSIFNVSGGKRCVIPLHPRPQITTARAACRSLCSPQLPASSAAVVTVVQAEVTCYEIWREHFKVCSCRCHQMHFAAGAPLLALRFHFHRAVDYLSCCSITRMMKSYSGKHYCNSHSFNFPSSRNKLEVVV